MLLWFCNAFQWPVLPKSRAGRGADRWIGRPRRTLLPPSPNVRSAAENGAQNRAPPNFAEVQSPRRMARAKGPVKLRRLTRPLVRRQRRRCRSGGGDLDQPRAAVRGCQLRPSARRLASRRRRRRTAMSGARRSPRRQSRLDATRPLRPHRRRCDERAHKVLSPQARPQVDR